ALSHEVFELTAPPTRTDAESDHERCHPGGERQEAPRARTERGCYYHGRSCGDCCRDGAHRRRAAIEFGGRERFRAGRPQNRLTEKRITPHVSTASIKLMKGDADLPRGQARHGLKFLATTGADPAVRA